MTIRFRMHFDALVNNERNHFARTRVKRFFFPFSLFPAETKCFDELWRSGGYSLVIVCKTVCFAYNTIEGFGVAIWHFTLELMFVNNMAGKQPKLTCSMDSTSDCIEMWLTETCAVVFWTNPSKGLNKRVSSERIASSKHTRTDIKGCRCHQLYIVYHGELEMQSFPFWSFTKIEVEQNSWKLS